MNMKSLWSEFKSFAFKGNLIDLAVAVVLGTAFGAVINSLVKNIFMPLISYVTPNMTYTEWHFGKIQIGAFLGELVNFTAIALAIFLFIVKLVGMIVQKTTPPAPSEPTSKECPFCISNIPIKATKCAHCTADLPATVV